MGAARMSRRRALTDEQCRELAAWYTGRMSIVAKAQALGISVSALYDSIARGLGKPTTGERHKLSQYEIDKIVDEMVSRESTENVAIGLSTSEVA